MKSKSQRIRLLVRYSITFLQYNSSLKLAIVDGSGVLYDSEGINREELFRLATKRLTISSFDTSKLGKTGFRVLIDDDNVKLPSII